MALATTTELEAVNIMLATIGEAPINSLEVSGLVYANVAISILAETSRAVQTRGWNFNTEDNYPFVPDVNGNITLPSNLLRITIDEENDTSGVTAIAQRGTSLYNKEDHTYVFEDTVKCHVMWYLEWTSLPQAARYYITIRAARKFQERMLGSSELNSFSDDDEYNAKVALEEAEADTGDYSIFDNYSVLRVLDRRV